MLELTSVIRPNKKGGFIQCLLYLLVYSDNDLKHERCKSRCLIVFLLSYTGLLEVNAIPSSRDANLGSNGFYLVMEALRHYNVLVIKRVTHTRLYWLSARYFRVMKHSIYWEFVCFHSETKFYTPSFKSTNKKADLYNVPCDC
jgi:hypothetical protein